jgi:hypothetical protein
MPRCQSQQRHIFRNQHQVTGTIHSAQGEVGTAGLQKDNIGKLGHNSNTNDLEVSSQVAEEKEIG